MTSHQWQSAALTDHLDALKKLVQNDPSVEIEATEYGFGGLEVAADTWVDLQELSACARCGAFLVNQAGWDYSAVLGGDYYDCKGATP